MKLRPVVPPLTYFAAHGIVLCDLLTAGSLVDRRLYERDVAERPVRP